MDETAIGAFLDEHYVPVGYRAQIMIGFPALPAFENAAIAAVEGAGLEPRRRVARMHPRPGEPAPRHDDLVDFFRRYGHEYCAALLTAEPTLDVELVTAAARAAGVPVLWETPI